MGGKRGGGGAQLREDSPRSAVTIAFNPAAKTRPFSLRAARDPDGPAAWDRDQRGRPRTFATEAAAERAASQVAAAPVVFQRVELVPLQAVEVSAEHQEAFRGARENQAQLAREGVVGWSLDGGEVVDVQRDVGRSVQQRESDRRQELREAGTPQARVDRLASDREKARSVFRDGAEDRYERIYQAGRVAGMEPSSGGADPLQYRREVERQLGSMSDLERSRFGDGLKAGIKQRQFREGQSG